jgi:hypothetical protein
VNALISCTITAQGEGPLKNRIALLFALIVAAPLFANAQWAIYHDPTIPRTKDGKPNLAAPAPRLNGKPDLSGIWIPESGPLTEIGQFLLPGGINGFGEDLPTKYFFSVFFDYPFGQEPMRPEVRAQLAKGPRPAGPPTLCPIPTIPLQGLVPEVFKIVQTPRLTLVLYEAETVFRQIFSDGRALPVDPTPSWLGYSVGKWMGDAFVVETMGFNDKGPLDAMGHPHSEALRLTETFRRRDFGHMDVQVTIDDPKTYTKPVTILVKHRLVPDTELLEYFCHENEQDEAHSPK